MKEKKTHHRQNPFIYSLFKVLSDIDSSPIISWGSDGQCFVIKDIQLFSQMILPKYFKEKCCPTFLSKLKLYNFTQLNENSLEFSHPLFKPGNFSILNEISPQNKEKKADQVNSKYLSKRVDAFRSHQSRLESILQNLEETYTEIVEQNNQMIKELLQTRDRENHLKEMLDNISSNQSSEREGFEDL